MGGCDWIEILCLYLRRRQFKVCPTKWYRMFRYICWRCRHMIRNKIGRPGGSHSRDAHYHWATFALLQVILAPPHYYLAALLVSTITYWCWSKICSSYYFFIYISLAYTFEVSGLTLSLMYIYCDLLRKAWFPSQLETCVYVCDFMVFVCSKTKKRFNQ